MYSARCRAEEALKLWEFLRPMTCVSAKGYELLRFLFTQDADYLSLNLGLPECQYALDADMIEILRQRLEPPDPAPERRVRGRRVPRRSSSAQCRWTGPRHCCAGRMPPSKIWPHDSRRFTAPGAFWRMADDLAGGFSQQHKEPR